MKNCPSCRLRHPDESEQCECGYNFLSGARIPFATIASGRELASTSSRLAAQLLDAVIGFALMIAMIPLGLISENLAVLGPIMFLVYFLLADGLPNGQSLGKRLVKIAVVDDESGKPCTLARSAVRNVTQLLGVIDWVWIFGERRKRAGDVLAHTKVVIAG